MSIETATPAEILALRDEAAKTLPIVQLFVQGTLTGETLTAAQITAFNDQISALADAVDAVAAVEGGGGEGGGGVGGGE